jgi:hypothetical protein
MIRMLSEAAYFTQQDQLGQIFHRMLFSYHFMQNLGVRGLRDFRHLNIVFTYCTYPASTYNPLCLHRSHCYNGKPGAYLK